MNKEETYLRILIDTLRKKEAVLKGLNDETDKQAELLEAETLDMDAFTAAVDAKGKLLEELERLDEGFLEIYAKVRDELQQNPDTYSKEVEEAKNLIRAQTELTTTLSCAEERNRSKLELHLSQGRQKVKDFKLSSRTVAAYYKNMAGKHQEGESYFFNKSK